MKKFLSILMLFFWSLKMDAQLDTEHWFAPMFDRNSTSSYYSNSSRQYLFLSTNETTPFDVEIYSGNVLLTTIKNLSKGNPKYYSVAQEYIISKSFADLGENIKTTKGLHLKASSKFFANLRFSTFNHAEILTSKGQAGIGNKFYVVVPPLSQNWDITNFMVGILATENDTKIKISGYNTGVSFTNITPTPQSIEIILNKGESYILEGGGRSATDITRTGFIGAKIESNKPIGITNGSFNGQYVGGFMGMGSDIIMDQSVPVDRLGNEFTIIKGNGNIGTEMEGALIVATEDGTEVYVNNGTIPIATLNEGQYYIISDTNFVDRGNNHYNLYVKSTKNIYLYQLLGGVSNYTATEGFNYIPPLNCFLPTQVGEIGYINSMFGDADNGDYYTVPTKLNFITMRDANVTVDGYTLTTANGPFDVTGTNEWVTYSIPNVTGNINITSTKAITAGISAGSGAVGYGGYFSGFSTVIKIKKTGDCIPGVTLEIEDDFDSYQWRKNGVDIPGATSKTYQPTDFGNYSVKISNANCSQVTSEVRVINCTVKTTINENVCGIKIIKPTFSKSTQNIDLSTLKVVQNPTKGNISIDTVTGQITYTPNVGAVGTDVFSYEFSGKGEFTDTEIVTVNVTISGFSLNNGKIQVCKGIDGKGVFNLEEVNIGDRTSYQIKYYEDEAKTKPISNPAAYSSAGGKIYAEAISNESCMGTVEISLEFFASPVVNVENYKISHCDTDLDGKYEVDLGEITKAIVEVGDEVKYYTTKADAENNTENNIKEGKYIYKEGDELYVRVMTSEGKQNACAAVIKQIPINVRQKISLLTEKHLASPLCDTDADEKISVDLASYLNQFVADVKSVTPTYYLTESDAKLSRNAISSQREVGHGETYYIRFEDKNLGFCPNVGAITFDVKAPLKDAELRACPMENREAIFDLTKGNVGNVYGYDLKYYRSIEDARNNINPIITPNKYSSTTGVVYVKSDSDRVCEEAVKITLILNEVPKVDVTKYQANICDDDFDGVYRVDFIEVKNAITNAKNKATFYANENDAKDSTHPLPNQWSYSVDTDVFVRVESNEGCVAKIEKISFKVKERRAVEKVLVQNCNDDFKGLKISDFSERYRKFNAVRFYKSLADAQKGGNNQISEQQEVKNGESYFVRINNGVDCPYIEELIIEVQEPKKSLTLKDVEVCPTEDIVLDAGGGFAKYEWNTGETTQSIRKGVGEYTVKLTSSNGCFYHHVVKVTAKELPRVERVDIQDDAITITAVGGNPPYLYSLDGIQWQISNVFSNLLKGKVYQIYVKSKDEEVSCKLIPYQFVNIRLVNVITPNGDGINDTIDYSDLRTKSHPKFQIYDRYGALVFEGNSTNQFIWDGKANGRPLPTSSYWYLIEWQEPNTNTWVKTASWILLKNRD